VKIAYVTTYDPASIGAWSGLSYFILKTLCDCGFETKQIGNLAEKYRRLSANKERFYNRLLHRKYLRQREPLVVKSYSRQVEHALRSLEHDLVFSPGTIPIAFLKSSKPIVFWTDATFVGMLDFYPEFTRLCADSIRNGHKLEQAALRHCRFAIYSSEWAARTAINHYQIDPEKVKVIPFGANIDRQPTLDEVTEIISRKKFDPLRLLFVGVDWERKGGDRAIEIARKLTRRGIRTELHVVGCRPRDGESKFVIWHGFVSKQDEPGRRLLDHLFRTADFLVLPSRAECFGVVFAEASAYGIPSLTSDVGGTASAVESGVNGQLFPVEADPELYCEYILAQIGAPAKYRALALSSFDRFIRRLNWAAAGRELKVLLQQAVF
jgi:glycosyltransferase involved in cell wall biosynthesis